MGPRTAHNRIDGFGLVSLGNASRDVDVVPVPVCHNEESVKRMKVGEESEKIMKESEKRV
jgi:hypothetical protein